MLIFDPFGLTGRSHTWSPIGACSSWDEALQMGRRLAWAARLDGPSRGENLFWEALAKQLLAPLLFAANRSGGDVRVLLRWLGEEQPNAPMEVLRAGGDGRQLAPSALDRDCRDAYEELRAFESQPARTRGSVRTTARTLLEVYQYHRVQDSAAGCEITPERVLRENATLYLVADPNQAELARPLFVALLGQIVDGAYELAREHGGELPFSLLLALDEAGNAAPLPNLAAVASTGASHNIQVLAMFHDLPQIERTYGREQARTILNNHRAKVLLPGMSDLDTLRYFQDLLGQRTLTQSTRSQGPGGSSTSEQRQRVPLRSVDELRRLKDGHALLVYGNLPPAVIRLRLWFKDRRLRKLAGAVVQGR